MLFECDDIKPHIIFKIPVNKVSLTEVETLDCIKSYLGLSFAEFNIIDGVDIEYNEFKNL